MEKREGEERESLTRTQQRSSLILAGAFPKQTVNREKPEKPIWSGILSFFLQAASPNPLYMHFKDSA